MTVRSFSIKYHNIEIELLLAHVLKKPQEFLYTNPEYEINRKQTYEIEKLVKRRMAGEPVAYILGYKDFCGMRLKVTRDVLIPRPETEWVVEKISNIKYQISNRPVKILDLGTGSGCIIISLAKKFPVPGAQFTATDISVSALKIARHNAKIHKTRVKFVQSDLFKHINGKFDIIVANLPYIPLKMLRKHLHHKQYFSKDDPFAALKFEPAFALTDGSNTWQIYRRFFEQAGAHISQSGIILLEIDPPSRKLLTEYQKKYLPKGDIKFYRDFNNFWRYAEIKIKK